MRTEKWTIEYYLRVSPEGVVFVSEVFPCEEGYHDKLKNWMDELEKNYVGRKLPQDLRSPISRIRERAMYETCINLLSVTEEDHDFNVQVLPIDKYLRRVGAQVLLSQDHPLKLIAPDEIAYTTHFQNSL